MTLIREILMLLAGLLTAGQALEEPPRVQSAPPPAVVALSEVAPILVPVTLADLLPRDQVFELALDVSGSESWAGEATAVAHCESRWVPTEVGAAGEVGLLQIHPIHAGLHARYDLTDPRQNIRAAYELWSTEGWQPWSCAR